MNSAAVLAPELQTEGNGRRWTMVGLLWLAVLINYVDRGGLSIAAVPLVFGISPTAMGALLSAFFWSYSLLQVPAGYAIDRFGLKNTYAGAFALWSLGAAAIGVAGSFTQILFCRMVLGAGEAAAQPASLAYIRSRFRDEERGLPTAVYLTGMSLGPAAGAFFGSMLLNRLGWRGMFIGLGLGCMLWLIPWLALAPGRSFVGPTNLSSQTSIAVPWRMLLSRQVVWGVIIGGFFYSYYWYFCLTWLPAYLVMERHLTVLQMGATASIPFLAKVPMVMVAGRLSDTLIRRYGHPVLVRKLFVASGFLLGSSILLLQVVSAERAVLLILIVSLLGIAVGSANYWALTQAITPAAMTGRIIGAQNTIGNLAGVCAPIVTGWLVSRSGGFSAAIWFAGCSLLVAAAAYLLVVREKDANNLRSDLTAVALHGESS